MTFGNLLLVPFRTLHFQKRVFSTPTSITMSIPPPSARKWVRLKVKYCKLFMAELPVVSKVCEISFHTINVCFRGLRFQGAHPFQGRHSTFLPTSSLRLAPRSGSTHIPDPSHSRGSAPAGPALHPVPPINALYLHRSHLSLTPSTSGMRRHRPYPIRLRPLPGSVRPRPSLTAEGRRADCAGARQRRGLLTPTRISLPEGGKAIAGLTAGRTRGRASRRRSQRPREKGAGRPLRARWRRAWPVLDGARECGPGGPRPRAAKASQPQPPCCES